jgi:hypothetical protein
MVSVAAVAVGQGTLASFTASTTNAASTFATGSLVLSNQVASATACLSSGNDAVIGNIAPTDPREIAPNDSNCDALFNGLTAYKPGDTAAVDLTLQNAGSLNGSAITGAGQACTAANTPTTGPTGSLYHGAGDPCAYVQIQVQEYSLATRTAASATRCLYPAAAGTCAAGGTVSAFVALTSVPATAMTLNPPIAVNAGTSRYLRVTLTFPNGASGAENAYMGRQLAFGIKWTLNQ